MTEKLLSPLRTRPWPERWLTRVLGAALSCAAYLVCIPWDLNNRAQTPGSDHETTPVTGIGVIGLALILLTLASYFGRRDYLGWPLLLVAGPPAVLMQISFRTHPGPPDGMAHLWPLTWGFCTFLIGAGVLVAAALARRFRPHEGDSMEGLLFPHPT
ncbi:hypothetical protein [Streptomyces sp. NBC_00038]|uniref:hypothetical protein n=1 Tax=Streptomyces sp. NBC_00038 TaxID=2903615 RepID=UPI00225A0970|nr:hypothetical protein [Streptomyces sp. NBC_00038]MCX5558017.1 hypothetical protein [Streptomyces sp. NBC_00038]